jgi:hypothetical protein
MARTIILFKIQQRRRMIASKRGPGMTRIVGLILLGLAAFLAWQTHWFHSEPDLSRYPVIQLAYTTCKYERITHSRGSTTKQIAFFTPNGRYVMEDGVWKRHFDGPTLAAALSGGGTVRGWVHPDYPHVLRGLIGGKVDIPPEWGLQYDQRNMRLGIWVDALLAVSGACLLFWKRNRREA